MSRSSIRVLIALLIALALGSAKASEIADPPTPSPEVVVTPIPIGSLSRLLQEHQWQIESIEQSIRSPSDKKSFTEDLVDGEDSLSTMERLFQARSHDTSPLRTLEQVSVEVTRVDRLMVKSQDALEREVEGVVEAQRQLAQTKLIWQTTLPTLTSSEVPPSFAERASEILKSAERVEDLVRSRTKDLLALQERVATNRTRLRNLAGPIEQQTAEAKRQFFVSESAPLWEAIYDREWKEALANQVSVYGRASAMEIKRYVARNLWMFVFNFILFLGLTVVGLLSARRLRAEGAEKVSVVEQAVFSRPASSAFLATVLLSFWSYSAAPLSFYRAVFVLLLIPFFRLGPRLVRPDLRPQVYGLGALFILERLRSFESPQSLYSRLILLAMAILGCASWSWLSVRQSPRIWKTGSKWAKGAMILAHVGTAAFAISILANVFGNTSLAGALTQAMVRCAYFAVMIVAAVLGIEAFFFRLLSKMQKKRVFVSTKSYEVIRRRGSSLLRLLALWMGVRAILVTLGGFDLLSWIETILEKRWTAGSLDLSLGNIVSFAFTLGLGIMTARFIEFLLEETVFPRISLPRGVPLAISKTAQYLIVTLAVVFAFLVAGVKGDQFAILAGAFGVGIGFGLQNIVNNFVSGLILLYERPIQIGDVVDVSTLSGEVTRIGIRSSTITTFDGAEVIVPNATLISSEVVNWTLSNRIRRIEIKVGVGYGSNPERVQEILKKVAQEHKDVLTAPAPIALFAGFGDSTLDFSVRCWTRDYDSWLQVSSQIRGAILAAFQKEGIEIPFPQQDIHIYPTVPDEEVRRPAEMNRTGTT